MDKNNICDQCGDCCKLFLINLNESEYKSGKYKTIFEGITVINDFREASDCGANFLARKTDNSCIYLSNNCCNIHENRPEVCRGFFCSSKNDEHKNMREIIHNERLKK